MPRYLVLNCHIYVAYLISVSESTLPRYLVLKTTLPYRYNSTYLAKAVAEYGVQVRLTDRLHGLLDHVVPVLVSDALHQPGLQALQSGDADKNIRMQQVTWLEHSTAILRAG